MTAGSRQQLMVRFPGNYFLMLGGCYDYCVLINVLNHLHRREECYIQLLALVVDE